MATIGDLSVRLGMNVDRFTGGIQRAKKSLQGFKSNIDESSRDIRTLGSALTALSAAPALSILAGTAVTASGAIAALPAAATTAGAAMAALKLGTQNMGDALSAMAEGDAEKAQEALSKIAPAARPAVKAMNGLREEFSAVQQTVQANMFRNLAPNIQALGKNYLPVLKDGLGGVSAELGQMARAAIDTANTEFFQGAVRKVMSGTSEAVANLTPAVTGLMKALAAVVKAGQPLINQFTQWIGKNAQAAGAFLSSAEGAEWLRQKIAEAKDSISAFASVTGRLWSGLQELMSVLQTISSWFRSLPGPVQEVIAKTLAWGTAIGLVMRLASPLIAVITRISGVLTGKLGKAFGKAIQKTVFFTARVTKRFVMMSTKAVARATAMAASVTARFAAMSAKAIAQMAAMSARVLASWAKMAAGAMARAAVMATAWVVAMGPIAWVIAAVVGLVALIIANWDKVKKATLQAWDAVSSAVSDAWDAVVGFVKSAGQTVVNTVRSAWDSAMNAVTSTVSSIVSFVASLPGRILGALGNLGRMLWDAGASIIEGLLNGIKNAAGAVFDFVSGIGDTIASLKGPIREDRKLLKPAGDALMGGLQKGLEDKFRDVEGTVRRMGPRLAGQFSGSGLSMSVRGAGEKLADAQAQQASAAGRGMAAPPARDQAVTIKLDTAGADEGMKQLLRKMVRVDGHGDVQAAFGS